MSLSLVRVLQAASPEDIHDAIVRAFQAFIEVCVLDGKGSKPGQDGEELNIILVERALLSGVDAHYADGLTAHFQWDA